MNMEKIKEVFSDQAFVKGLFDMQTAAEVQAALKEKGVEMSEEEILDVRDLLIKVDRGEISVEQLEQWAAQAENGELPDEMLEQVSGGVLLTSMMIGAIFYWVGVGAAVGTGVGGLAVGAINAIERRW